MADNNLNHSAVTIDGEAFDVANVSLEINGEPETEGVQVAPTTFEGSITTTHEPGDDIPMPCPECRHVPLEAGATVDQLPSVECPECDWFDVLDEPLDEIHSDQ